MIARLLISTDLEEIKKEIRQTLASHLPRPLRRIEASLTAVKAGLGGGIVNHPDLLYFPADATLGIEQARKIKEHFSLKPYSAKGRMAVLENAGELTLDAQNALLKTIEELPESSILILASDSESRFLPTILSRCEITRVLPAGRQGNSPASQRGEQELRVKDITQIQDIEKLINSTIEQRFEYVEKLKDKEEFLQALAIYFHNNLPFHSDFLKELLLAEKWAKQNVGIRAILEYLMLVMPSS